MTHTPEDINLIDRAVRGLQAGRDVERNAALIYEKCAPGVFRFFMSLKIFDEEDCRDLTLLVFQSVYEGIATFRHKSSFETWLRKIAKHKALDELDKRKAIMRDAPTLSLDAVGDDGLALSDRIADTSGGQDPLESLLDSERRGRVEEAVMRMPPQMRQCLLLRVYQELSYEEIARALQVTVNTVKSTLHQARQRLRGELRDYQDGQGGPGDD